MYDALLTRSCYVCNKGSSSQWITASFHHPKHGVICLPVHLDCLLDTCESFSLIEEIKEIWCKNEC